MTSWKKESSFKLIFGDKECANLLLVPQSMKKAVLNEQLWQAISNSVGKAPVSTRIT